MIGATTSTHDIYLSADCDVGLLDHLTPKGFVKLKKIKKSEKKLGSGWVGQAPTRIIILGGNFVFFCVFLWCFFLLNMFPQKIKKMARGVGWLCLANLSFSRIFGFFLNLTKPLKALNHFSINHEDQGFFSI